MTSPNHVKGIAMKLLLFGALLCLLVLAINVYVRAPETTTTGKPVINRLGPYLDTEQARAITPVRPVPPVPPVRPPTEDPDVLAAIVKKAVHIGMTPGQVRRAWGPPEHINESVSARHHQEQWVYGGGQHLYFDNGVLTTWQTSRPGQVSR